MRGLRSSLVALLVAAVPWAGYASVLDEGHCGRSAGLPAGQGPHAQHGQMAPEMGEHAQHLATPNVGGPCNCGCNCMDHHCGSSAAGFAVDVSGGIAMSSSPGIDLLARDNSAPATAYHLDLLRPPITAASL